MHRSTCIFWANLTRFLLQHNLWATPPGRPGSPGMHSDFIPLAAPAALLAAGALEPPLYVRGAGAALA